MIRLRRLCSLLLLAVAGTPLVAQTVLPPAQSPLLLAELPDAPAPQQNTPPSAAQPPTQDKDSTAPLPGETEEQRRARLRTQAEGEVKQQEKQRIAGGVMPGFNIVMNGQAAPLSSKQKFSIVFHSLRDPYYFGIAAASSGIGELTGSHKGYGWGPGGYFKRFGAAYADNADAALFGNAILPSLWHQDPRYFRKGSGSAGSRMLNAALSNFICHGDNGRKQFNFSNVVGNLISGGISNAYYPSDERGLGLTFENSATVTAYGVLGAQLLEFGPDLNKLFHHKKKQSKP